MLFSISLPRPQALCARNMRFTRFTRLTRSWHFTRSTRRACHACLPMLSALLMALPCQAAEPPPVFGGLWEVRSLITFDRVAAPGLQRAAVTTPLEPSLPRRYRICLAEPRTLAPMMPPRMPRAAELSFDSKTVVGTYIDSPVGAPQRFVEFGYRRLGSSIFEGSQDVQADGRIVRLQYYAQRVSADCAGLKPSVVQPSGEP
jgi:hypothetical protein